MSLLNRLTSNHPKKILSLDGGGVRNLITLGFLEQIESILRSRYENPNLRLSDYFDLIGGTGAGAVIAGMLCIGMQVSDIKKTFNKLIKSLFYKNKWKFWKHFSTENSLENELKKVFKDVSLGSPLLKTGICIITKRADTGNTWLLTNHPRCVHFNRYAEILLRKALCASFICPDPFLPQLVQLDSKESYPFIDGSYGIDGNPSVSLFLLASLQGYPFRWQLGENNLLLVSVGCGFWQTRFRADHITNPKTVGTWKQNIPYLFMNDAVKWNQLFMQYISKTQTPWEIDRDKGNLAWDLLTPQPAITYLRYDLRLEPDDLHELGFKDSNELLKDIHHHRPPTKTDDLIAIGYQAGKQKIFDNHFPDVFFSNYKESDLFDDDQEE